MKNYFKFLIFSYLTAFFFEFIANTIGDGKLFESPDAVPFFLVWYGLLYSILFVLFRNRGLIVPVIALAILGPILEVVVFKRLNIIVDPIIYALMAFLPFYLYRRTRLSGK